MIVPYNNTNCICFHIYHKLMQIEQEDERSVARKDAMKLQSW